MQVKKKNLCVSGAQHAPPPLTPRAPSRSGRLLFLLTDFCPRPADVGTAERTRPPQAAAECAGAVRTDVPGASHSNLEAEVGRFEPVICVCDENNKAGENPTPPRPRPGVLAARTLGAPRAHPQKRQGKCGRGGRRGLGRNAAPPSISGLRRCDSAHGTRFHFFAETVGFEPTRPLRA